MNNLHGWSKRGGVHAASTRLELATAWPWVVVVLMGCGPSCSASNVVHELESLFSASPLAEEPQAEDAQEPLKPSEIPYGTERTVVFVQDAHAVGSVAVGADAIYWFARANGGPLPLKETAAGPPLRQSLALFRAENGKTPEVLFHAMEGQEIVPDILAVGDHHVFFLAGGDSRLCNPCSKLMIVPMVGGPAVSGSERRLTLSNKLVADATKVYFSESGSVYEIDAESFAERTVRKSTVAVHIAGVDHGALYVVESERKLKKLLRISTGDGSATELWRGSDDLTDIAVSGGVVVASTPTQVIRISEGSPPAVLSPERALGLAANGSSFYWSTCCTQWEPFDGRGGSLPVGSLMRMDNSGVATPLLAKSPLVFDSRLVAAPAGVLLRVRWPPAILRIVTE